MRNLSQSIDKLINEAIAENSIAGANVMMLKNGKEEFFRSYGYADKEKGLAMKRDTIFRLFSMSKPITSAAVMMLLERGEIELYMPVSRFLKGFKNQCVLVEGRKVPADREVTIRDLLNMTSGICYPGELGAEKYMEDTFNRTMNEMKEKKKLDTIEFCNRLAESPLAFQPGEKWMYGFSADILGGIVSAVTGMTFGEFLKEEIFKELNMKDTGFVVPKNELSRLSQLYIENFDSEGNLDGIKIYEDSFLGMKDYSVENVFESGGAGLVTTIDDYARFAAMLEAGGTYEGKRLLGSRTVAFMRTPQLTVKQKEDFNWDSFRGYSYGNLLRILESPAAAASVMSSGEFGWDGWTGNYFYIDPVNRSIVLFFIQKGNTGTTELAKRFRTIAGAMLGDM